MKSGPVRTSSHRNQGIGRRLAWSAAITLALAPTSLGQVTLREGRGQIAGPVVEVGPAGVAVDVQIDGRAVRRVIGWDRIKLVTGDKAPAAAELASLSEALWRARSRLERGDWLAAEPLLTPIATQFAGPAGRGPTAAVVFEGLLRARLSRGARAGAITAWLEMLATHERSNEPGTRTIASTGWARPASWVGGEVEGLPVIDVRTGLTPALPPIWVGEPAMEIACERGEWAAAIPDAVPAIAAELAAWYALAGRFESGSTLSWPKTFSDAPGPRLVRLIVQARAGDGAQRETARESLRGLMAHGAPDPSGSTLAGPEDWEEAWCRAGIGRSLLREDDREQKIRGVVQLLHVPARLSRSSPYLAGVCIAEAAVALADLGDVQAAAALKQELLAAYPGHPAIAWSRLQGIKASTQRSSTALATQETAEVPPHTPAPEDRRRP